MPCTATHKAALALLADTYAAGGLLEHLEIRLKSAGAAADLLNIVRSQLTGATARGRYTRMVSDGRGD